MSSTEGFCCNSKKVLDNTSTASSFSFGVRSGDSASVFLNVRTWNIWLRKEKEKVSKKVIEAYKQNELEYIENSKMISGTIKKAKLWK